MPDGSGFATRRDESNKRSPADLKDGKRQGKKKIFVAGEIWGFEYLLAELLLRRLRGVKPTDSKPGEEKSADWESIWKVNVNQSNFCRGVLLEFGSGSS